MKVQIKGEPFEYFSGLVLVLYLNSLSFLLAQLYLTVDQASGRDKGLCRISNSTGHLVLLWWFFFSFCLWSFHDLSSFLCCPLSLSSASSLLGFFSLFLPPWCSLHHACALSLLPKHWVWISQHHQVNSHTFLQCFPPG